jgi:glycosyltransferase involved in cell wall biosynthesis
MISVITATRNRHHELRRLLESLRAVVPPSCKWEVVVVDDNSAAATAAVLREMIRLPVDFDPTRHVPALDAPAPAIDGGRAQG